MKNVSDSSQVKSLGLENPNHWNITNYVQIDLYQKRFLELLSKLKENGVRYADTFQRKNSSQKNAFHWQA
ncbi:hypothetical protein [Mesobacillus harenae]|uniref:hypothetical protein n=1 Tax=Mesobacillus harenae TaxID=2213203 RepID=UPI001580E7CF|nr:hypothetical protein [Mesobacillus harenae]